MTTTKAEEVLAGASALIAQAFSIVGMRADVVAEAKASCDKLSPREREALIYLSKGFTIKETGELMGCKWFTVNDHCKSIFKKLRVDNRVEAAVIATKAGLV